MLRTAAKSPLLQKESHPTATRTVPYNMNARRGTLLRLALGSAAVLTASGGGAQGPSGLPATSPTGLPLQGTTAPIAASATVGDRPGSGTHPAHVTCTNGQLEVRAQNSSLNGILRAIANCTGMKIVGGVAEQRVFGNYGPAAPATVLATLIDGTGSNMLLSETAADQPMQLILTPRIGGATPPPPSSYKEENAEAPAQPTPVAPTPADPYMRAGHSMAASGMRQPPAGNAQPSRPGYTNGTAADNSGQTPVPPPLTGSAVTSPPSLPQPLNNVNGSPNNTSPTVGSYPTTNSVPLDSIATPSTTPSTSGLVDAPNPPPAGSDTAAALNGAPAGTPGTTNISPDATSQSSTPGGTNTTVQGSDTEGNGSPQGSSTLTPEQIFQQLRARQQQQQEQGSSSQQ